MGNRTFPAAASGSPLPTEPTRQAGWAQHHRMTRWVARMVTIAGFFAAGLLGGLGLSPAHAQVLHEPVVVPELRCQDRACRRDGAPAESLPEAVMSSEGLIGAPPAGRSPEQNEKIYSGDHTELPLASGAPPPGFDPPPVRRAHVTPDSDTGVEPAGERLYHEVFNPAVFPYKRMTVVDAVGDDSALTVRDPSRTALALGDGRVQRGRDPFYASVVVDFTAGQAVPLPTPAAGVRVVSYRATPDLQVRFLTDGADNLFALAAHGGRYRLVYLVEAEPRYFAGPLWSGAWRPRLRDAPAALLKPLPRRLQREARTVLQQLGVRYGEDADYGRALDLLVAHFRAFSMAELDQDAGAGQSMYLKLALQQRGVCRHRSYAFVITALAAGIPARYVENELHVFVEVYVPQQNGSGYWRRINLGGAPLQQRVVEGENKVAYQEKGGDPFPRPAEFHGSATPSVSGLPPKSPARRSSEGGGKDPGGGGTDSALPRLDGPEDRARRGEGPTSDTSTGRSGDGPRKSGDGPGKNPNPGGAADPTAPSQSSAKDAASARTAKPGSGGPGDPNKLTPGAPGPGTAGPGELAEESAPEFPPDDDISQPEDRRRDPASDALISTHVTVTASAARRVYRGMAIPVRGHVQTSHGSPAGLQVLLFLAIPSAPQAIGRAFTTPDGSYQTEVEIPAGVPLGSYPLIARVKGDQTHRGSSTGHYDHPEH